jgi:uncharacterized protein with FMN-binding domain
MKKFFLSFFVFAASVVYVVYQHIGGGPMNVTASTTSDFQQHIPIATTATPSEKTQPAPVAPQVPVTPPRVVPPSVKKPTPAPILPPPPPPTPKPKGQYKDGVYTGSPADAYYGTVQIQATIQDGRLAAVDFLQYPNDRRTSQYINSQAMPILKREALQAQSADVSGVSGASDTSPAFIESLGDALAQAKN